MASLLHPVVIVVTIVFGTVPIASECPVGELGVTVELVGSWIEDSPNECVRMA